MRVLLSLMVMLQSAFAFATTGTIAKVSTSDGGVGTAWVAHCDGDITYWVTAAHVVGDDKIVTLGYLQPRRANVIGVYPSDDIAILESVRIDLDSVPPIEDATLGDQVTGCGYADGRMPYETATGPLAEIHETTLGKDGPTSEVGIVTTRFVAGMSGGPVVSRGRYVGMVHGYYSDSQSESIYITSARIRIRLAQCLNGRCQVPQYWVTPQPRMPILRAPIVIPAPAYNVTPITPIPSPVPQPQSAQLDASQFTARLDAMERALIDLRASIPQAVAGPRGERGERGLQGPLGPPGLAGPPPTDEQIAAAVAAWMQFNQPSGTAIDQATIERAVAAYIAANPQQITVIVKDNGVPIFSQSGVPVGSKVTVPIDRRTSEN